MGLQKLTEHEWYFKQEKNLKSFGFLNEWFGSLSYLLIKIKIQQSMYLKHNSKNYLTIAAHLSDHIMAGYHAVRVTENIT